MATQSIQSEYAFALDVLKQHVERLTFPLDYFMWYSSRALIEKNSEFAKKALETAEIEKSGFRFHQNLGLVGKEHEKTIKLLLKLCT